MRDTFRYAVLPFFLLILTTLSFAQNDHLTVDEPLLTPQPSPKPRLNNALVYGCRPGNEFLYRIPCQGERPIQFSAKGLPEGLSLDKNTGIIRGTSPAKGSYNVTLTAKNKKGKDLKTFRIISGNKIGLTPPMGWNHWYAFYHNPTDGLIRVAADKMVSSGMADVGYSYVNIDDCWNVAVAGNKTLRDSLRFGRTRDENGNMLPNIYFPDMKGLTGYIHAKGLKAGIYSSPGKKTCAFFEGSYSHEEQDAKQFAEWGFDFLKYDWCYYSEVVPGKNLETYQMPFSMMGRMLKMQKRDIFFNLCQYGMGNVWEWGASVGGNSWRTAGDLGYALDKIFDVAIKNAGYRDYNKPGEWNDPDYIQIGYTGSPRRRHDPPVKTKMPPWLQYSYMSLWSLMASPLFFSGDMEKLDAFTLNILCNPEIIAINQDPLGQCGKVIMHGEKQFLMVKDLHDGSKAVGLFNRDTVQSKVSVRWEEIGVTGKRKLRDAWRMKNLGTFDNQFNATIPAQGCSVIILKKIGL